MENPFLHWLLAIKLVILAEVHVFLNPGTKKQCCLGTLQSVKLYSSSGCPCELNGPHIFGGDQQSKVMLCQSFLRSELFIESKITGSNEQIHLKL